MADDFAQNFKQLPTELQRLILTQSPELLTVFSQADKTY